MVPDLGNARLRHACCFQVTFRPAVLAVKEFQHAAHGFGAGVHPTGSIDGVTLSNALLFQPGGVKRFQLSFAEGVVLYDSLTRDARYGQQECHDDAGAIFAAVTVDGDGTLCHACCRSLYDAGYQWLALLKDDDVLVHH